MNEQLNAVNQSSLPRSQHDTSSSIQTALGEIQFLPQRVISQEDLTLDLIASNVETRDSQPCAELNVGYERCFEHRYCLS